MPSDSHFDDLVHMPATDVQLPALPGPESAPITTSALAEPGETAVEEASETASGFAPAPAATTCIGTTTPEPVLPPSSEPGTSLDQVRDLLFGDQCSRIDQIEGTQRELRDLIARIQESTEELRAAVDGFSERFDAQPSLASGAESRITEISDSIGARVASMDERLTETERALRGEFIGHKAALVELVQERANELFQLIPEELRRIKNMESDRVAIAGLLHEVARRFETSGE